MNEEEEHMRHNRYRDMVAYESNVITLSSEQGSRKLCYKETLIPWLGRDTSNNLHQCLPNIF